MLPETVAGRDGDCDLVLTIYRGVSRRHARFYVQGGTWCVEDMGSTNGTFVNNVRANPSFSLADGVMIQMGDFHARFRFAAVEVQRGVAQATQYAPTPPMPVAPSSMQPYPAAYPVEPPKAGWSRPPLWFSISRGRSIL